MTQVFAVETWWYSAYSLLAVYSTASVAIAHAEDANVRREHGSEVYVRALGVRTRKQHSKPYQAVLYAEGRITADGQEALDAENYGKDKP